MAKTDSTGQFVLVSDGTSPASPVIADGAAVYTPGLSERRGGASLFRHDDLLGSLRFLTDSSEGVQAYRLFSGFGATVAASGAAWEPFGWAGDAGDQTDADTGLVLMGHRLYDSRLGRFISQDPAGDGDNWYAYCDNDPINGLDPEGLQTPLYHNLGAGDVADGTGQIFNGNPGGLYAMDAELARQNGQPTVYGYWDHGVPTGFPNGRPTVEDGMVNTHWIVGDISGNIGDFVQAIAPFVPKRYATGAGYAANAFFVRGTVAGALASWKSFTYFAGEARVWAYFPALARVAGARAGIALLGAGLGSAAAIGVTAYTGWQVGTAITNHKLSSGGTVSDYLTNNTFLGVGSWFQQNTSFGH